MRRATCTSEGVTVRDLTAEEVAEREAWSTPTLDEARARALERIEHAYNTAVAPVATPYPDHEREGWGKQEQEAVAYQAAVDAGETPPPCNVLSRIASQRGLTLADLVGRVLANVADYEAVYGDATGIRQRLEGEIEAAYAAGDVDALQAIDWPA